MGGRTHSFGQEKHDRQCCANLSVFCREGILILISGHTASGRSTLLKLRALLITGMKRQCVQSVLTWQSVDETVKLKKLQERIKRGAHADADEDPEAKFVRPRWIVTQKGNEVKCQSVPEEFAAGNPRADLVAGPIRLPQLVFLLLWLASPESMWAHGSREYTS